jgi:hypothetical protein
MSTLNVGAMAARLGLDPSEFLEKMKGVEGFASGSGQRIAAEMKRTSREGAESLRLIDEALGVHLSRPVTRIISQEFPALASGLQSILGAGVLGAIGIGVVDVGEKIAKAMEKAQKAQEAYRESLDKLKTGLDEIMAGYAKSAAERNLTGIDKKAFEIDTQSLSEARRQLDELSKDAEDAAKKGAEASGLWSRSLAAVGDAIHVVFTSSARLGVEETNKQFAEIRKRIEEIAIASSANPMKGLGDQLAYVQEEARKAAAAIAVLIEDQKRTLNVYSGPGAGAPALHPDHSAEIAAQQAYLDLLKKIQDVLKANAADNSGAREAAAGEDYAARLEKQQVALQNLLREIEASYAKLAPIANPFSKVEAGLEEMRMKAENDFAALAESGASALELRLARQRLDEFMGYWKQKMAEARQDAELFAAQQALAAPSWTMTGAPGPSTEEQMKGAAPMPNLGAPTTATPVLSLAPMRADLAELEKVQNDTNEAWTKAGEVLQSIETPAQKVETELAVLRTLLDQGRISQQQYNAAVALTSDQLTKAAIHVRELREELEKLEKNSTSVSAGFKGFAAQLQLTGSENGKFAFDLLTQGLNSFEDDTVKILEHGRVSWRKYFEDLAAMALKFAETKTLSTMLSSFTHPPTLAGPAPSINPNAAIASFDQRELQNMLPLPQALPPPGALGTAAVSSGLSTTGAAASSTASMTTAGTTLTTAGTTLGTAAASLSAAAAALNAAAASMSASGAADDAGADAGGSGGPVDFAGFFAGGGDVMPGQDFIAGEEGPELIQAGSLGANVTPNSKLGGTSVYNDFRGTVMTDELMRRAEGLQAIKNSEKRMMAAIPTLQREINLRQRSNR